MAPLNQPKTLYRLAISSVSQLVDTSCANIFLEHGCFGKEDATRATRDLQRFLVSLRPTTVFEQLSEDRNSLVRSQFLWSDDQRIKLGVFLHPSITKFSVDKKGNELFQHTQDDCGLDEFFWCSQLARLGNLTHLNLNLITTDDILHAVGNSCPKLEVVNIVSRIKQDVSEHTPGLTLKFCVSDIGLRSLMKCLGLRRITMNKIVNQLTANKGISFKGVKDLVAHLPRLEFINFGCLGKILAGDSWSADKDRLRLKYFSETDPAFVDVARINSICPGVEHLSLSVPLIVGPQGGITSNVRHCSQLMHDLAASTLPLRIVELQHFPFDDAFRAFLKAKGGHIEELLFRPNEPLNSEHLLFIGEHCPRVSKLHVKDISEEVHPLVLTPEVKRKRIFSELTVLHIGGRLWNPNVILPLALSAATKLQHLFLLNLSSKANIDGAVSRVLQDNPLTEVVSISFFSGCRMSNPMVRRLIFECPRLDSLTFIQSHSLGLAEVEALRQEVAKKNLDITLCCVECYDHDAE